MQDLRIAVVQMTSLVGDNDNPLAKSLTGPAVQNLADLGRATGLTFLAGLL